MFKKYREWIDKATDYEIIGDRALIILGDSLHILENTNIKADSAIFDPPYDFDASGGKTLFNRPGTSHFETLRNNDLAKGFDYRILTAAALADSLVMFLHNDEMFKALGHLTEPRVLMSPESLKDNSPSYAIGVETEPLYPRYVIGGWNKLNPMPVANKHYLPDTEFYIHAWRPPEYPQGDITEKGRFVVAPVGKSKWNHPTVKPQRVMRKIVLNASKEGDYILDPFAGSGSTGVAALSLGRYFIGIEKSTEFYDVARERLHAAAGIPYVGAKQAILF